MSAEVWVEIPRGYVPLPLTDPGAHLAVAEAYVADLVPAARQAVLPAMTGALTFFLETLAAGGAVYCGLGRHLSTVDGQPVTSSLVIALQEYPAPANPRAILKELLARKATAGERGQADLVYLGTRPTMFFERTDGTIYQLQALVPSRDATTMAMIEFSTSYIAHGPQFREMIVTTAASTSFTPPTPDDFQAIAGELT